jgi:hypothetical protein
LNTVFSNSDIVFETNDGDNIEMIVKKDTEIEDHFKIYLYNYEQDIGMNIKIDIYQFASLIQNIWPHIPQQEEIVIENENPF